MRRYKIEGHSHRGLVDTEYIIGTRKMAEEYACKLTEATAYTGCAIYYIVTDHVNLTKKEARQ
jgi:hypothetical protein